MNDYLPGSAKYVGDYLLRKQFPFDESEAWIVERIIINPGENNKTGVEK